MKRDDPYTYLDEALCIVSTHQVQWGIYGYDLYLETPKKSLKIFFKLPLKKVEYPFDNIKFDRVHRIGCS